MPAFVHLQWDSDFFAFPVARLRERGVTEAELAGALEALRARGTKLAYWLPEHGDETARIARRLGGFVAGAQAHYERDVPRQRPDGAAPGASSYAGPEPDDALLQLARGAGRLSRFALDPRMPEGTVQRLYDLWIRRSVRREIADEVLVAPGGAGVVTLSCRQEPGVIGLVAVDEAHQRRGTGRLLMDAAIAEFARRGVRRVRVSTQEENRAACALYEASGYARASTTLAVHFWL